VGSLDATQIAAFCDWISASVGGYGSIDNCDGGGSAHAYSTQASCVSSWPKVCPSVTAGALEDCVNSLGGDLCRVDTAPECAGLMQCGSGVDAGASSGG
jgi:hypothetical protein